MKKKTRNLFYFLLALILPFVIFICAIFFGKEVYAKFKSGCPFFDYATLVEVKRINNSTSTAESFNRNIPNIPSEGTHVTYYDFTDGSKLIEVSSAATLYRSKTNYYIKNGDIFYIEDTTDEWDLKKLHGEHGELSVMEGEYVIATTSKEAYITHNRMLCKYISNTPRQKTPAVDASNPEQDITNIFNFYDKYIVLKQ